jgi:hypothetical protein
VWASVREKFPMSCECIFSFLKTKSTGSLRFPPGSFTPNPSFRMPIRRSLPLELDTPCFLHFSSVPNGTLVCKQGWSLRYDLYKFEVITYNRRDRRGWLRLDLPRYGATQRIWSQCPSFQVARAPKKVHSSTHSHPQLVICFWRRAYIVGSPLFCLQLCSC